MLYDQTVPLFTQQTRALVVQLTKAEAWCRDSGTSEAALLDSRLAPDMFPLARQLDFVTAQMLQPMRRLAALELPDPAEASANLADHKRRLSDSMALLSSVTPAQVDADPDRFIALDLPNGMAFDLSASDYVRDWAMPQYFFHAMAAYAILRASGVPLGKADFVPHMMRHARKPAP